MKGSILAVTAALAASGCTLLGSQTERAAEAVGKGVTSYCENFTPDQRSAFRARVNYHAAPHALRADCIVPSSEPTPAPIIVPAGEPG